MYILLPQPDGSLKRHSLQAAPIRPRTEKPSFNRVAYAAAHVVVDPLRMRDPWNAAPAVDWDATLRFREHLWSLGFKVAEAMDTSQRGMGLDWPTARELIERSLRHARTVPGADIACGVGTDQLLPGPNVSLQQVESAYREQLDCVEREGGRAILMASRALAACARGPEDYLHVYGRLIESASRPVILHWLGEMFDPALRGYWGSTDIAKAQRTVLQLIEAHSDRIEGIKVSLLEARWERALRDQLPPSVKMYTGDDFNYAELMAGDGQRHSHALLGIFDAIAPVAAAALEALAEDGQVRFKALIEPTVPLSREIFRAPTRHYKAGVVFLAWLNGHQPHFTMAGGLESARDVMHYVRVFELADACGALQAPELAAERMSRFLRVHAGL